MGNGGCSVTRVKRALLGSCAVLALFAGTALPAANADTPTPESTQSASNNEHSQPKAGNGPSKAPEEPCQIGVDKWLAQAPSAYSFLGMKEALELSRGNVRVALVDSGVAAGNAHFKDAVEPGVDLVESGDGRKDSFGHGTAIAGQIAAREVSGSGVVGFAPQSTIVPVRVYVDSSDDAKRAGKGPTAARTADGIRWAADQGIRVIVVPQSLTSDDVALRTATQYAHSKGALVVASAGNVEQNANSGSQDTAVRFPAGYPEALSVTAVDAQGNPSQSVVHGTHVEIAAPGAQIATTFFANGDCMFATQGASTSYATGYVGAIAALIAARYPDETPDQWKYRLLATALRSSPSQRTAEEGWGIVAPFNALNFVNDGTMPGPQNPIYPPIQKTANPVIVKPDLPVDTTTPRRLWALGISGAGLTIVVAVLLIRRLRSKEA